MVSEPQGASGAAPDLGFILVSTPQLRALVGQRQKLLAQDEFADLIANIRAAFDKFTSKLKSVAAGVDRAVILHLLIDRELQAAAHLPVSCQKGCAACCHYEVEITSDEAVLRGSLSTRGSSSTRSGSGSRPSASARAPPGRR